ncbi:MAG: di-heme oxidoredictase family protein [Gemmatimonadota bacterium]
MAILSAGCDTPPVATAVTRPGDPLPGLTEAEMGRFLLGKAVFERLATEEEGLGPLFNAPRCSACHESPTTGGTSAVRVVKAASWEPDPGRCDLLHELGGDNFQTSATALLVGSGLGPEVVPPQANSRASVLAPTLYGLGLVEAIPQEVLDELADPDDADGDGISGRTGADEDGVPGRFGRKGEVSSLRLFIDTALRFELGFSTPDHPREETVNGTPVPPEADPMGEPEIDDRGIDLLTDYIRFLAAPSRRLPDPGPARDSVDAGERLFGRVGCDGCHVPELRTGRDDTSALSRVAVPLYSDLLLHDLGPELAGVCAPGAAPAEHRTSRLWGIGLRDEFLHDGRARSLEDAIRYHGGEASASRTAFQALGAGDRRRLVRFLESL